MSKSSKWNHLIEADAQIRSLERALAAEPDNEELIIALEAAKRRATPWVHPWLKIPAPDHATVWELRIAAANDSGINEVHRYIRKKMAKGNYDYKKAPARWIMHVDKAAKDYAKGYSGAWHEMFPRKVRRYVAAQLAQEFEEDPE